MEGIKINVTTTTTTTVVCAPSDDASLLSIPGKKGRPRSPPRINMLLPP